jgi:hypothetical protein
MIVEQRQQVLHQDDPHRYTARSKLRPKTPVI